MIIGSNNNQNNFTTNFNNRFSTIQNNNQSSINMKEATTNMKYTDVNNSKDMKDKAYAMLQNRLANGTISIEEFNKQCHALGKIKNK